ncbi:transglutaminase-like domain-containing protein [Winogradskyella epiphytica]|uniref:transglutaminase-like domain-containing protein n=1 Tax=Winogradskyella epiphytica TaxID=262005 RepID=UPI001314B318|nr:transglutaminase-like domain-containing protein [Winogradskyella epiphytica]
MSKNSSIEAIQDLSYNDWNAKEDIPPYFYEINTKIFKDGKPDADLELIKQLVTWLYSHSKVGPGLSEPSDKALETLLYGKGGVCSDMAQVFNNFCVINDIKVREWGTTSAPFSRDNGGHSFNEVFIKELNKWVLIDPSWGMLFFEENKEQPLSVLKVFEFSRKRQKLVFSSFIRNKDITKSQVNKNYLNPDITPFLICAYRNKTYDRYLKLYRAYLPVFIIHFLVYLTNKSYHYKFPLDNYKSIFS